MRKTHFLLLVALLCNSILQAQNNGLLNYKLHAFYYNWYGNPDNDQNYRHWNHQVLPHWNDTTWNHLPPFSGGENIGANYYPELGCYSSNDTAVIEKHMQQISEAGIGVIVITWWGKQSYEDISIKKYLHFAEKYKVKLAFHIEPFYKTINEFREAIVYIIDKYSNHPAFYKLDQTPVFYIYDSYKLDSASWATLFSKESPSSLRNTKYDAIFIGLWVNKGEESFFTKGGFDGVYTYFASTGFTYGSTPENWEYISTWAKANKKIFIPCVGPGYCDTRIRPWNSHNTKDRNNGVYYDNMFRAAISENPEFIGITSFNEWHEGTQIEPSVPKKDKNFTYEDYSPGRPDFYLKKTKSWSVKF